VHTRKALVTGCCGFIGSHVTRQLIAAGWDVEGVDDLSNGDLTALEGLEFRTVTEHLLHLYDKEQAPAIAATPGKLLVITSDFAAGPVLSRVAKSRYDVIFHLAANPRVEFSVKYPALTTHTNVQKTIELMSAAIHNIDRFVFASSSACYGEVSQLPTNEGQAEDPTSPYGLQKLVVEQFGEMYNKLYEMDFVALRFFNVYGPGQLGDSPYSTAIAAWCTRLSKNEPLRSDGDGEQTRDMVYVKDIATAMLVVADHDTPIGFEVYNVATGESVSNNQILATLKEHFSDLAVTNAPERAGDVKHTLACINKIGREIGWSPQVQFWDGLGRTLKWWELIE
jgi:nucleoside-diphosphate-sugar epimerase